ncbi:MAG: hypothetical protein ABH863_01430 [Candidatus Micrarchaeota archaeon]
MSNKYATFWLFLALLLHSASAIVIIPPVVYFVTLSISTFISSSIVAMLLFGGLKALSTRKYWGKGLYQLLSEGKSAIAEALLAIICMLAAVYAIYPVDFDSAISTAFIAAALFMLLKFILSFRLFDLSDNAGRRALLVSWATLAMFVALATTVSALASMQSYKVFTGTGGYQPGQVAEKSPLADILPISAPFSKQEAAEGGRSAAPENSMVGQEPKSASDSSAPPTLQDKIWFIPKSPEICNIFAESFALTFTPSFNCISEVGGARNRIYCPVYISHSQVGIRGDAEFRGTGSCTGIVYATVTDTGFEHVR